MVKKKNPLVTALKVIAIILATVLVLGLFTYTKLSDTGFFLRHTIAMKSENYEVNNAEMSYFFNTNYASSMQNNSSYYEYYNLDTSKALDEQQCALIDGTWYEYFMEQVAVPAVEQVLILCEAAKAAGYEMPEEDRASIDEAIANIETTAESSGYTTSYYVMNYYGAGVQLKDVRSAMEKNQYAYSYYNHIIDGLKFTEEDWDAYYAEHEDDFQKIDYISYTFAVEDLAHLEEDAESTDTADGTDTSAVTDAATTEAVTTEAATTEAATTEAATTDAATTDAATGTDTAADTTASDTEEEDEHAHTELLPVVENYANELAAKTTAEDFSAYIENYLNTVLYAAEEEEARAESVADDMDTTVAEAATYSSDDETLVELFKLAEGDTYIEKNEEDGEFTVYYITKPKYIEDYATKNARLIILSDDDSDLSEKVATITKALEETPTAEKFIELAKEYSVDTTTAQDEDALYENVGKNDFSNEQMIDWLYSSDRVAGDMEAFSTTEDEDETVTTNSAVYHYIARYESDGMVMWQYEADELLRSEAYNEKYTEFETNHGGDKLTVDKTNLYKIPH